MSKFGLLIPKAVPSMTHHHHADKIDWDRIFTFHSLSFLILGVLCACVALNGFMVPNNFLDGGVTGVCILLSKKLGLNLNVLIALLNAPFIWIGYKKIGKTFAVQTTLAIVLLTIGIEFVKVPIITDDKVLIALFGGFFIGLGIGLAIRSGCVLDGLEVVADYTNRKSGFSTSELVMMFNTMVILSAAIFFDWEVGMYSIITYFTAMKISDYVVDGFEEYTALTVISGKHEMVKNIIVNDFNKAISVFKGERGYLPTSFHIKHDCDIILTIVTRLEIHRLKLAILEADPAAFVYIQSIKDVKGGVIKQKHKH